MPQFPFSAASVSPSAKCRVIPRDLQSPFQARDTVLLSEPCLPQPDLEGPWRQFQMSAPGGHPQLSSSVIVQLAYPTRPRAQRESGLSGHGGLLMHVASTTQAGVPPAQGRHRAGGEQGATPHSNAVSRGGKGLGAHVLSPMHLPGTPDLLHATETSDHPTPCGYTRGDQLSHLRPY